MLSPADFRFSATINGGIWGLSCCGGKEGRWEKEKVGESFVVFIVGIINIVYCLLVTRFYPAVTLASLSCGGSMVSGRKSACAAALAQSNIASERAGLTGECL
ncbi:hypothetical protein Hanom_Chr02g00103581 [Helianthus anomalus]